MGLRLRTQLMAKTNLTPVTTEKKHKWSIHPLKNKAKQASLRIIFDPIWKTSHFPGTDDRHYRILVSIRKNFFSTEMTAPRLRYEIQIRFLFLPLFQYADATDRLKTALLKKPQMISDVSCQQPQKITVANSKFNNIPTDSKTNTTKKLAK